MGNGPKTEILLIFKIICKHGWWDLILLTEEGRSDDSDPSSRRVFEEMLISFADATRFNIMVSHLYHTIVMFSSPMAWPCFALPFTSLPTSPGATEDGLSFAKSSQFSHTFRGHLSWQCWFAAKVELVCLDFSIFFLQVSVTEDETLGCLDFVMVISCRSREWVFELMFILWASPWRYATKVQAVHRAQLRPVLRWVFFGHDPGILA